MYDVTDLAELKRGILRTILIRRITLGVFSAVALIVLFTSPISFGNPLIYSPLLWFLLTFPFRFLIARQRTLDAVHRVHTGFFLVEVVLITILVHFMGGSEWIGVTFYMFTVIYANTFLTRVQGAAVTLLVVLSYSGLALLEYAGILPHRTLFTGVAEEHRSLTYTLTTILAGGVGLYAVVALTVRSFSDAFTHKARVLSRREEELSVLSRRLLAAQDDERRRIAHSLHDDLIQTLAAVKLRLMPHRDRLGDAAFAEIAEVIDHSIAQTRSLAYTVRPPLLDDLGLVPALERLADTVRVDAEVEVHLHARLPFRPPVEVESLLYAIAQEAVQNAVRHAQPTRIDISLRAAPHALQLSVIDDGIGVDSDGAHGLGLRSIAQRAQLSGGRFTMRPRDGRGSILEVEVPLHADTRCDHR
jgi:signal transduction histidine kinase